jgi:hypothetical protein
MNVTRRGFLFGSLFAPLLRLLPKRQPSLMVQADLLAAYDGVRQGLHDYDLAAFTRQPQHFDRILYDDLVTGVTHEAVTTSGSGMFHVPQSE